MLLGLLQYSLGRKHLGDAGRYPATSGSPDVLARERLNALRWTGLCTALLVGVGIGMYSGLLSVTPTQIADAAGYFLLGLTGAFFGWLYLSSGWTPAERKQLYVIGVLFLAAALFWSQFEQAGTTLNLFADRNTRTSILGWAFPSTWFQSLNALFIVALAPLFAWVWVWLGRRGAEPSSPAKFGVGLVLVGAGFAVLVGAAVFAEQGVMVSPMWLVAVYFLHTCGELFLSPVGLSAMSKLAPVRIGGLIMGVWFLAAAVGNYIGGRMAGFYDAMTLPNLFGSVAAFGIGAGILLLLFVRPMRRLTAKTG
jgi:POT family proton-dependent oligopeptide transporter